MRNDSLMGKKGVTSNTTCGSHLLATDRITVCVLRRSCYYASVIIKYNVSVTKLYLLIDDTLKLK